MTEQTLVNPDGIRLLMTHESNEQYFVHTSLTESKLVMALIYARKVGLFRIDQTKYQELLQIKHLIQIFSHHLLA